jgi:two-component system, NarL family, sensor histidine kinase UhpB
LRSRSLLIQVLAINLLLIAAAAVIGAAAVGWRIGNVLDAREAIVLGLALLATLLGNWLLLHRRFRPLDELISAMEHIDRLYLPGQTWARGSESAEVRRLRIAFERMIARMEAERLQAGRAVIQAQERERRRLAQDLHDEVNQALTAVALRLQATIEQAPGELRRELIETKRLAGQAMDELLALARQLRPAVLDDHGLLPALQSQVRDFSEQSRIDARFHIRGPVRGLTPEEQLVIYRVTQESLSNIVQHAQATKVVVELSFVGRTLLSITDDGRGLDSGRSNGHALGEVALLGRGGLGLSGMRERALLIGGRLRVFSAPGEGTRVELRVQA